MNLAQDRDQTETETVMKSIEFLQDLKKAQDGSYYTIVGVGGDLQEWVEGYEKWLEEANVGKPQKWYRTNGGSVNSFADVQSGPDAFKGDLEFLMFPLDDLNIGRLALFKLQHQDRWFDDIIANMHRR